MQQKCQKKTTKLFIIKILTGSIDKHLASPNDQHS